MTRGQKPRPIAERFWEKVDKNGPVPEARPDFGPCWLWMAYRDRRGYGSFTIQTMDPPKAEGHKPVWAHRMAYELAIGPVPDGLCLDHLCYVKSCVNPAHLEVVTFAENTRRNRSAMMLLHHADQCAKGHNLTDHGYIRPDGQGRICRTCQKDRERKRVGAFSRV